MPADDVSAARPLWLRNLLAALGLTAVGLVLAALAGLFVGLGWTVAEWITLAVLVIYGAFLFLALLGYVFYLSAQEVRRGNR